MGFCQSYDQTWKDLAEISKLQLQRNKDFYLNNLDKIQVVADNLNITVGVNHQRIGHNLEVRNYTAAFVMVIPKIPISLTKDLKTIRVHDGPREDFNISSILPVDADDQELRNFGIRLVSSILHRRLNIFKKVKVDQVKENFLRKYPANDTAGFPINLTSVNFDRDHFESHKKCNVLPLPLMDLNENVIDEMEEIIDLYALFLFY